MGLYPPRRDSGEPLVKQFIMDQNSGNKLNAIDIHPATIDISNSEIDFAPEETMSGLGLTDQPLN